MGRQLTGMIELLGTPAIAAFYADAQGTAQGLRQYLEDVLGNTWWAWWTKAPPRKPSKKLPTAYLKGGHSSVYKIRRGLHKTIPEPKTPAKGKRRPSKQ
jgi:hypothetical protein